MLDFVLLLYKMLFKTFKCVNLSVIFFPHLIHIRKATFPNDFQEIKVLDEWFSFRCKLSLGCKLKLVFWLFWCQLTCIDSFQDVVVGEELNIRLHLGEQVVHAL